MIVLGVIGATALYLLYVWLISAALASWLSERKGYGPRPGLAMGLLLTVFAVAFWLVWPAKPDSRWKLQGALGRKGGGKTVAEARAEMIESGELEE